ncbi:MAG: chorismate mutase [Acholeplasmataceae bacterium]
MKLDELRLQINRIDEDMLKLFEKRMHVAKQIGEYKKEQQLPVFDEEREKTLLKMMKDKIEDKDLSAYYESFLIYLMSLSKDYQHEV